MAYNWLQTIVIIVLMGLGIYLINAYVPMPHWAYLLINVLGVIVAFWLILALFGIVPRSPR